MWNTERPGTGVFVARVNGAPGYGSVDLAPVEEHLECGLISVDALAVCT